METYCGSEFWNQSLSWDTDDPDFTPCFQNTVFVWTPCLFLWLTSTWDVYKWGLSKSRTDQLIWTRLSLSKIILTCIIILLDLSRIISKSKDDTNLKWINFTVTTTTFVYFILLVRIHRSRGVHTSGPHLAFWLLNILVSTLSLRSTVKRFLATESDLSSLVLDILHLVTLLAQCVIHCWSDHSPWQHSLLDKKPCPELRASFLSRILYSWVSPLTALGYRKPLENEDLWDLRPQDRSDGRVEIFLKHWKRPLPAHAQSTASMWRNVIFPLWQLLRSNILKAQFCYLFTIGTGFLLPQILDWLIMFVQNPSEEAWKGYLYATLLLVTAVAQSILFNTFYFLQLQGYLKTQAALVPVIYRKTLAISSHAKKEFSAGEITNLMTVDMNKIREFVRATELPWSIPLKLILALYFLYRQLGPSVFVGFFVMFLPVPINYVIFGKLSKSQAVQMKIKDDRVKKMSDILSGMKTLKLFAWEDSFKNQVKEIRSREIQTLRYQSYLNSFTELLFQSMPFLVSLTTFATYTLMDPNNRLDARKAFVSIALFNLLKMPIVTLPQFFALLAKFRISCKRLSKFLNAEENDPNGVNWIKSEGEYKEFEKGFGIEVTDGQFTWGEENNSTLDGINISIGQGELVAVVGAVASGKSSLLSAILGEMKKVKGQVSVVDSLAYVPQIPWIRNSTLKENILFGAPFDAVKYEKVLESCALKPDLAILPGGDKTEIGEKGINLSGGQKQRVALARAAYQGAQVFLLDDPLSAVDVHVGEHLFEKLIGPRGMLGRKTRMMVTHSLAFLPQMDKILVMKDGTVTECGTYKELRESKGAFSEFLSQHERNDQDGPSADEVRKEPNDAEEKANGTAAGTKLIEAEVAQVGNVKFEVFLEYFRAIGWPTIAIIIGCYTISQGFSVGGNVWLSMYVTDSTKNRTDSGNEEANRDLFLGGYTGLGLGQIFTFLGGTLMVYMGSLFASQKLHNDMLTRIMHAPMSFFDTTPLGRILNRFAEDTEAMDSSVCWDFVEWMSAFCQLMGILAIISFTLPLFIAVIVPAIPIYYLIYRYYGATTRQVNRLMTILRSPLYSHFAETLAPNGTATIGAFKVKDQFIQQLEGKLDSTMGAFFALMATRRWLSIRLEFLAAFLVFFASLFAVMSRSTLTAGVVGLAITYALQITDTLSWLTKVTGLLEPDMVCVERVLEYASTVEQEADYEIESKKPPRDWPQHGQINFENVNLRYREGLDLVLKDVNFTVYPGEKVGVVGRTGAGKSSLTAALFRLIEMAEEGGSIKIDGVNLSSLGLYDVRRCLTIIPQDPVLFPGTLRMNLDPFNDYLDDELWDALKHAHLKAYVDALPEGLEYEIAAGGENLSVGQRQLVCIARAILRKPKILILDEATAAIDLETDELIQKTIRVEFEECTVITIAHRLNTIMDSSRILVLENGTVKEFDTPANLLAKSDSIFRGMTLGGGSFIS